MLCTPFMARPRRLDGVSYVGQQAYFITACARDRRKAFLAKEFCDICRDELFAIAGADGFAIDAYVLMPDHVHFECEGLRDNSSLPAFVSTWKQRTGWAWHQRSGSPLWQEGYYDRVLRENDNALSIARYIVENPLRARLVTDVRDYPTLGRNDTNSSTS